MLDTARREAKRWRLEQLTQRRADADLDPATAFFVLAWDAFEAPVFAYDEALRLTRAVSVDLEREVVGRLRRARQRPAAVGLDAARGMIDAVHHTANLARTRSLDDARKLLDEKLGTREGPCLTALEAVLEVLPVTKRWTGSDLPGEAAAAGSDLEALYHLARLAYGDRIDEPEQVRLWQDEAA